MILKFRVVVKLNKLVRVDVKNPREILHQEDAQG
jgi:hypothetical protein